MKSFRAFLTEVETLHKLDRKGRGFSQRQLPNAGRPMNKETIKDHELEKVGRIGKDHDVYRQRSWGKQVSYHAIHRKTGTPHVSVHGTEHKHRGKKTSAFEVNTLGAHKKNTVKAHQLYHHILKKHHSHLISSDEQSEGGKKTWHKLVHTKGVDTKAWKPSFHWDHDEGKKKGKYWNIDVKKKGLHLTHHKSKNFGLDHDHGKSDVRLVSTLKKGK